MNSTEESRPPESRAREFRYERKFFIDELDARQAIALIKRHPRLFRELYPARYINNIYLDSPLMSSYLDNLDGSPERKKARVRWYHDLFRDIEQPTLEFKIKNGIMGTKIQHPLKGFQFNNDFNPHRLADVFERSNLPPDLNAYCQTHQPVLVNRYLRWYFATPDRNFRVTIDSGLTYYHLNKFSNHFLHRQTEHKSIVVELKYSHEFDPEADRISAGFPFRMTRSSKYVNGIERVYL